MTDTLGEIAERRVGVAERQLETRSAGTRRDVV